MTRPSKRPKGQSLGSKPDPVNRSAQPGATVSSSEEDVEHLRKLVYVDGAATFQVRILGLFSMVDKAGAGITNDETVTLMNDVLVMAPAAVLYLPFTFETESGSVPSVMPTGSNLPVSGPTVVSR